MLTASNITMQFGAKPLFENVSIKFGDGNRYGLIGANGCGKSTFMKILGGDLEPSAGNVSLDPGERLGKLRQDQFAFEDLRVLDVVLMGHELLWNTIKERDAIYADPDASDADYLHAAELEAKVAELDGYTAEARAGELLLGVEIEAVVARRARWRTSRPATSCACCWRRRCSPTPTSCCSTNRPTISTSTPYAGSKGC